MKDALLYLLLGLMIAATVAAMLGSVMRLLGWG